MVKSGAPLADIRIQKYANVLVEHSARVKPGDRILLEGTTAAEPILRELYIQILEKGGKFDLDSQDRRELDDIIFDALDLTTGEREAVYEAVIDLVSKRLQKANTISS